MNKKAYDVFYAQMKKKQPQRECGKSIFMLMCCVLLRCLERISDDDESVYNKQTNTTKQRKHL